jgi:hypothetical protein
VQHPVLGEMTTTAAVATIMAVAVVKIIIGEKTTIQVINNIAAAVMVDMEEEEMIATMIMIAPIIINHLVKEGGMVT